MNTSLANTKKSRSRLRTDDHGMMADGLDNELRVRQKITDQVVDRWKLHDVERVDVPYGGHANVNKEIAFTDLHYRKNRSFGRIALASSRLFDPAFYVFSHLEKGNGDEKPGSRNNEDRAARRYFATISNVMKS